MSTPELQPSRTQSASRTPLPQAKGGKLESSISKPKQTPKSDVARQQAWLIGIEAEDFYANVPCTD